MAKMSYNKAIWDDYFIIAGPLNKFTGWATILLSFLGWALEPINPTGGYNSYLLVANLWRLIAVLLAGIFYLVILQKAIELRDLSKRTHIWLLVCFGLSCFAVSGVFIWAQFVLVGILSDTPFWRVLFQGRYKYYWVKLVDSKGDTKRPWKDMRPPLDKPVNRKKFLIQIIVAIAISLCF